MHTVEGTKAKRLACSVIIQALEDAFLLKRKTKVSNINLKKKNNTNIKHKADAVTWLKGENDAEGLKRICGMTDIEPAILVKKAREWFSGDHTEGYEFNTAKELKEKLGVDLCGLERDIRRMFNGEIIRDETNRKRA